jgi:hypothetical protein
MDFNIIGEILDTIASLTCKWGRWLNAKGKKTSFLIWAAICVYWVIRDLQLHLYSQAFFCTTSIFLNLYGYWNWNKKKLGN